MNHRDWTEERRWYKRERIGEGGRERTLRRVIDQLRSLKRLDKRWMNLSFEAAP